MSAPTGRRLLILSADGTAVGGVTRVTLGLFAELQARGWVVSAVYPGSIDAPRLLGWAAGRGLSVEVSRDWLSPASGKIQNVRSLLSRVRAARPDVVNLHYGGAHIPLKDVLAVRLAGVQTCVVSLHAPTPWSGAGRIRKWTTRLAATLCSRVIPCSAAVADVLREAGVSGPRVTVVPGGVQEPGDVPTRNEARAALGIADDAFVVGTVVRLSPEKGVPYLIEAVAGMQNEPPLLLIKGDRSSEWQRVTRMAADLLPGHCIVLDADADNEHVFAATDVFALPSLLEGYPLVLMEAASRSLPCVATDVGSVSELVVDGQTGIVVPPADVAALRQALQTLRADAALRAAMGRNASERARVEFSESLMAERYARAYQSE